MPIFEYSCLKCQHRFEKLEKAGATVPVTCPACGSEQIRKELSVFAATGSSSHAVDGCSSSG